MAPWRTRAAGKTEQPAVNGVTPGPQPALDQARAGRPGPLAELLPPDEARHWLFPGSDELYRSIYTTVAFGVAGVLAVTSAITGEGKSTTALGLAVTAAQDAPERRVLLVEADLDRPVLASDFDVEPSPGLVDCLLNDQPVQDAYRRTFLPNLQIVPAGIVPESNGRLIRSPRLVHVLEAMKRSYDLIIFDGPAVLVNSDAIRLTDLATGTIFVVRTGVTPSGLVRQALDRIEEEKLRCVVLNGQTSAVPAWLRRLIGL
jgi:capsular exopolysaccharide synthesis family protein